MKLEFPQDDADLAQSLSAAIRVGDDLWVGSDEGIKAMCLRRDKGDRSKPPFRRVDEIDLVQELDLPGKAVDERGRLPEVDLEGTYPKGFCECQWGQTPLIQLVPRAKVIVTW